MNTGYEIRLVEEKDAAGILEIYRPFVEDNAVTFENVVPDEQEMIRRILTVLQKHVWLVCLYEEKVVGYAYTSTYREREAYQWVAESSIYLHANHRQRGIGRILYHALIALATMQGYTRLYGIMTVPNPASQTLHESLGFRPFATFQDSGYKLGAWHATQWFELVLDSSGQEPGTLQPIQKMIKTEVGREILEMAEEPLNLYDR
jgi:L-amino acid N-acyltransferase YncA